RNKAVAVKLTPVRRLGTVEGAVIDPATGRGIPGAHVGVLLDNVPLLALTATTDSAGKYAIGHLGFARDLRLQVTTTFPPCVAPRPITADLHQRVLTKAFALRVAPRGHVRSPPALTGLGPTADSEALGAPLPGPPAGSSTDPPPLADSGIQWQPVTD